MCNYSSGLTNPCESHFMQCSACTYNVEGEITYSRNPRLYSLCGWVNLNCLTCTSRTSDWICKGSLDTCYWTWYSSLIIEPLCELFKCQSFDLLIYWLYSYTCRQYSQHFWYIRLLWWYWHYSWFSILYLFMATHTWWYILVFAPWWVLSRYDAISFYSSSNNFFKDACYLPMDSIWEVYLNVFLSSFLVIVDHSLKFFLFVKIVWIMIANMT